MKPSAQVTAVLAILLLAACGGSSSGNNSSAPPPPPAAAPVKFATGAITATAPGTLQVDNLTLSTTGATVLIEKVQRTESELKPGMVVKVRAHHDGRTGEALEIAFEDAVKGKVGGVGTSTLSVGGQTVRVDDGTEFEDNAARLASIRANDRVRVSGVPDDRGGLRAGRIERDQAGLADEFEIKGLVSGLSATGFTLKLSPDSGPADTYTVNLLGGATLPAGLANGAFVEVRSQKAVQTGNVIEAASITLEDHLPGLPQSETEIEGIVTSATGSAQFMVNGTPVTTGPGTTWSGGLPEDLVVGVKVEVEGVLGSDGTLAARKVSFRANIRLQGAVTEPSAAAGTFKVNGIPIKVDALTDQRVSLASLTGGQLVQIRGTLGRDGTSVVATRLESTTDDRPGIQGVVTAKDAAAGTLTILGKTIGMASASTMGHSDVSGMDGPATSLGDFFASVTVGQTVVKARGKDATAFVDPILIAKEVSLEGDR